MFYNLFSAAGHDVYTPSQDVPLMIWLQGGPGASSQFGAFTEMGPIRIDKGVPSIFHSSWNIMGHMVFIDSPLNVGFSYNGNNREGKEQVSSANQAADHLVNFLYNLYSEIPALKSSPLYITGESFAGHYIPALAKRLISNETFQNATGVKLAGISIGDGWTDPLNQINFYDSYLWSVGVVDRKFRDVLTWYQTNAIVNIYDSNYSKATTYFDFITNNDTTPLVYFGGISTFNFRNYDGEDMTFAKFLEANKAEFNVTVKYLPGNDQIYTSFANDVSRSYANDVIYALRNVKVMIYNGQNDFVVNTAGVLQYLNSLNWEGINQWKRAEKEIWTINGEVRGWAKCAGNLWFVLINGAGHMVPTDQPDAAFSMLGHFLYNERDWKQ